MNTSLDYIKTILPGIKGLILDMDGVLVDTEPIHMKSFAIFLDRLELSYDDGFLQSLIGYSIDENIRVINQKYFKYEKIPVTEGVLQRDRIYVNLLKNTSLQPMNGIKDLIDICSKKNLKLALASSSDREQVDIIIDGLKDLKLRSRLKSIVSGDEVEYKKPQPEIYLKTQNNLGLIGRQCLAIEDSDAGVSSARAAGCYCLALKNPYTKVHKHPQANGFLNSILEITDIFRQI
ncbi:MAG: HAD family phosphatase [Calditrichaceae bacterium]|nr:HAD family phosphatase [Calditrichaceae bacterium]MBN2710011.1 HAD family phosphatase [Calditrichaceae bacterium]RQV97347.1 MAG: HAD family phosphatase [Calditrichota bacterium]